MYGMTEKFDEAILGDTRKFFAKIKSVDVESVDSIRSIKRFSQLSSNNCITVGGAISSYVTLELWNPGFSLENTEFQLEIGIELDDGTIEWCPLGYYTGDSPKTSIDGMITITAYDRIQTKLSGAFFSALNYPTDAINVLNEISAKTGVPVDTSNLSSGIIINQRKVVSNNEIDESGNVVEKTTYENPFNGYTYKETLGYIAMLYCKYAIAGRDGVINFAWYSDVENYKVTPSSYYDDFETAELAFSVNAITCNTGEEELKSGTGTSNIQLENPVMTQERLDFIYAQIKTLTFVPAQFSYYGDIRLELCDTIKVEKLDGTIYSVPVMNVSQDFDGGLKTFAQSYGGIEQENSIKSPLLNRLDRQYTELLLVKNLIGEKANFEYVYSLTGEFKTLKVDYGEYKTLVAQNFEAKTAEIQKISGDLAEYKTVVTNNFTATNGKIDTLSGNFASFKTGDFANLKSDYGEFKTLTSEEIKSTKADITSIKTNGITTDNLEAAVAEVGYLKATDAELKYATIDNLNVLDGKVGTLSAKAITTDNLAANVATLGYAKISTLEAEYAKIDTLETDYLKLKDLSAETAKLGYLKASEAEIGYAKIDFSNVGTQVVNSSMIIDGAVTNEKVANLSANKITSGTIDASKINVTNLNADNLTVGTINGQRIGVKTIDLSKLSEEVATKEYLDSVQENLQGQIDGAIETFTKTEIPTLLNEPASLWTDNDTKKKHIGDICYVVNPESSADGYCYRFANLGTESEPEYAWVLIKDSDVTKVLQEIIDINGEITGIKKFDSEISSWKTDTDNELSSVKSRTTTLETNIGKKVDSSVFNELTQTVDKNSATITSLSTTVKTKADSTTVTELTNTVNSVKQTTDKNTSSISSMQTVIDSKADGTTVTELTNRTSLLEQSLDGFKLTVSNKYATKTALSETNTKAVNAQNAANKAAEDAKTAQETADSNAEIITTHSSQLSANENQITALVSDVTVLQGDYNGLDSRTTKLELDSSSFELELSSTKKTVSDNYTDLKAYTDSAKSSAISTAASDATSKANSALSNAMTEINATNAVVATHTTTLSEHDTRISATENSISLKVWSKDITNAVDSIEVGGRNLLSDTKAFGTSKTTNSMLVKRVAALNGEYYRGLAIRHYEGIASNVYKNLIEYDQVIPEYGRTYTFSFWAKGSGIFASYFYDGSVSVKKYVASDGSSGTTSDGFKKWSLTDAWQRYWISYTLGNSGDVNTLKKILIRHDAATTDLTISLAGLKLEKGNKATDWTPAPEDVDSAISTVDGKFADYSTTAEMQSAIDIAKDQINLSVSKKYTTKTDFDAAKSGNLVKNGFGEYLDATNFAGGAFTRGDCPEGCYGYFTGGQTGSMPFDPTAEYDLRFYYRRHAGVSETAVSYFSILPMDVDGNLISVHNIILPEFDKGLYYLSRDLKDGDTIAYFTDLSTWTTNTTQKYQRSFLIFGYKDSTGYTYPDGTYSRYLYNDVYENDDAVDKTNHTITLKKAWSGGTVKAGTCIGHTTAGSTYCYYGDYGVVRQTEWTKITNTVRANAKGSTRDRRLAYAKVIYITLLYPNADYAGIWLAKKTVDSEARLKLTKDGIVGIVGNYYAYDSDLASAESRITNAESTIAQHADLISLKVSKDGIISAINQSAEEVKISAAKITLEGATIADSFTATNLHITGNSVFDGTLNGATGTFTGTLSGATGDFSGKITATSGKIGAWNISDVISATTSSGNYIFFGAGTNGNQDVLVVRTGTDSSSYKWPIILRATGEAIFNNATITGSVETTALVAKCNIYLQNPNNAAAGSTAIAYDGSTLILNGNYYGDQIGNGTLNYGKIQVYGGSLYVNGVEVLNRIACNDTFNYNWRVTASGNLNPYTGNATDPNVNTAGVVNIGNTSTYIKNLYYGGALEKRSDRRLKNHIGDLTENEACVLLSGSIIRKFTYKNDVDNVVNYGVYAQDLRDLLIQSGIGHNSLLGINIKDSDGEMTTDLLANEDMVSYTVDYTQYAPVLVSGWQNHDGRILSLESRQDSQQILIDYLLDENAALKKRVKELEKAIA